MAARQILLVSPNQESAFEELDALLSQGEFILARADSTESARAYFQEYGLPYLVIVDLQLPGQQGLSLCKELHDLVGLPMIALASTNESQQEALAALGCADDYVRRDHLSARELARRSRRILSRVHSYEYAAGPSVPLTEGLSYIPTDRRITVHGEVKSLTPIENAILQVLVAHRGQSVDGTALIEQAWQSSRTKADRNALRVHVHRLRQKIEQDAEQPQLLLTIRNHGYMLAAS